MPDGWYAFFLLLRVAAVLYLVVRAAVRDGIVAAVREVDVNSVRSELRLGPERSPNSRRP